MIELDRVVIRVEEAMPLRASAVDLQAIGLPIPTANLLVAPHVHHEGVFVAIYHEGVVRRLYHCEACEVQTLQPLFRVELQHLDAARVAITMLRVLVPVAIPRVRLVDIQFTRQDARTVHEVWTPCDLELQGAFHVGAGSKVDPMHTSERQEMRNGPPFLTPNVEQLAYLGRRCC